jgi:PAS domain S-box-containing protein
LNMTTRDENEKLLAELDELRRRNAELQTMEIELMKVNQQLNRELERREQTEEALLESEEKFKILSEKSLVGIFIWQNGRFKYVNPAFALMFDYSKKEIKKKIFCDLTEPEDWPLVETKLRKLKDGQVFSSHFQFRGRRKDGNRIYLDIHEARIQYNNEPAIIGTFIDVTRSRMMEDALKEKTTQLEDLNRNLEKRIQEEIKKSRQQEQLLMQQSKLVAMGEMVGAIAHQWRQPLTSIGFIIQNLQSAYEIGKFNQDYLDKSVDEAMSLIKFMSRTIDDFRNFFVISKLKERFEVVKMVEESLYLLHAQLENNYIGSKLNTPEPGPLTVIGYPNEFKQVLINIISNAKNAIIERREKENLGDERGIIHFDINSDDGNIILKISNNGVHIPSDILDRIFEPYFTTQESGKGMGIGLYMSKIIIEKNMGGKIFAENIREGARFTISLTSELPKEEKNGRQERGNERKRKEN